MIVLYVLSADETRSMMAMHFDISLRGDGDEKSKIIAGIRAFFAKDIDTEIQQHSIFKDSESIKKNKILLSNIDVEGSTFVGANADLAKVVNLTKEQQLLAPIQKKDAKNSALKNFFYLIATVVNPFSAFLYLSAIFSGLWKKGFWGALGALTVASLTILTLGLSNVIVFQVAFLVRRGKAEAEEEEKTLAKACNYGWSLLAILLLTSILAVVLLPFYPLIAMVAFGVSFVKACYSPLAPPTSGAGRSQSQTDKDPFVARSSYISSAIRHFGSSKLYDGITAFIDGIGNLVSLNTMRMNAYQRVISTNFACSICIAITAKVLIPASHALLACFEVPILVALLVASICRPKGGAEYLGMAKLTLQIFSIPGVIVGLLLTAVAIVPLAILFFWQVIMATLSTGNKRPDMKGAVIGFKAIANPAPPLTFVILGDLFFKGQIVKLCEPEPTEVAPGRSSN